MGQARSPQPVKPFCGVLAGRSEWLDRAGEALKREMGAVELVSDTWPFDTTDYYEDEMGPGLLRRFYSFRDLMDPENLVGAKLATNRIEERLAKELGVAPKRPVNLDPGYVSLDKLVLATTKDYAHRLYLRSGIYAEVTLRWRGGRWEPWEWTYPDYRKPEYHEFFVRVRNACAEQRRQMGMT